MIASNWHVPYLGLRYLLGGRTRAGLDCWGLVCLVYREQRGIELPVFDGKAVEFDTEFVRVNYGKEFDIAFFDGFPARSHCGIVLEPNRWVLHATMKEGVTCSTVESSGENMPDLVRRRIQ